MPAFELLFKFNILELSEAGIICFKEQKNLIHPYFSPRISAFYNTIYQRKNTGEYMSNIIGNYVGGSTVKLNGGALQDVFNPSTGEVSGQVQLSSSEDLDEIVEVAKGAVPE